MRRGKEGVSSVGKGKKLVRVSRAPPPEGVVKVNVDVGILGEQGVGLGVLLRDHIGEVLRMALRQLKAKWSVDAGEPKAFLFGLQMAREVGANENIVEGNSLTVVNLINKDMCPISYCYIVRDIIEVVNLFVL